MSSSASSSKNVTGMVASVAQLVSGIATVSGRFIKQSTRTARLERAKKILEECENFLTTLNSDEISRIERHQPLFMSNMKLNLQEAKTHRDHLNALAADDQGWLKEVSYWGNIYTQISELLNRLEDLKRVITVTTNAYRNAPRFSDLPVHHLQSGVGPAPQPSINNTRSTDSGGMQRPLLYPRDSLQSTFSSSSQNLSTNDSMQRSFTYPPQSSQPIPIPGPMRTSHSSTLEPPAIPGGGISPVSTHTSTDSWHTAPQSYTSPQLTNRHKHTQADSDRAPYSSGAHMSQPSSRSSHYESSQNLTDNRNPYSSGREVSPARRSYEPSQARADYSSWPSPRSSDNDDSSRGFHPLFASSASGSNTASGYNSQRQYSADSRSHTQSVSTTIPRTNTYDDRSGSSTYHDAGNPRYSSASTAAKQSRSDQAVSRNVNQETANLSMQSLYISSGPTGTQSENRQQPSFMPSSSTVVSNPVSQQHPTSYYNPGFNPLAAADASTSQNRRQSSFITTGALTSASQRHPTSHYDPSFRALTTEVDDDSEGVSAHGFSSASSSATVRQSQIYRTPSQNFLSYNDRGSAEQNYASGSTPTWIPPSTEDPQRVQRSFSSTSHTSASSTHQGSSRSGQYTTYRQSRREGYDDDSSDEDDDDNYDNRTHERRQEWTSQVPYGSLPAPGVSAARPHHPVSGGATPKPARPSTRSQDENERQQSQRSSAFYHPPPRPPSFYQQTGFSAQGVTTPSSTLASSYAQHQQPASNYPSIPASTSASSYAQQTGFSTQGVTMPSNTSASSYAQHQQPTSNYPSMPASTSANSYAQQYGQQHHPSSGNTMYTSSASQQAQARSSQTMVIPRPKPKGYDEHYGYNR